MSDSILQVNQIKDKGGNATGITVADSTANVTIGNLTATSLAGGTIESAVNIGTQDYMLASPSNQTISDSTYTAIAYNAVNDPKSWFNNSTKKFTPTKAGKYFVSICFEAYAIDGTATAIMHKLRCKKNDAGTSDTNAVLHAGFDGRTGANGYYLWAGGASAIISMNGSSDYLFCNFYGNGSSGSIQIIGANTHFSAVRVGP